MLYDVPGIAAVRVLLVGFGKQQEVGAKEYRDGVRELFRDVDVLLAPATPCRAPKIGQKTFVLDGDRVVVHWVFDIVRPDILAIRDNLLTPTSRSEGGSPSPTNTTSAS